MTKNVLVGIAMAVTTMGNVSGRATGLPVTTGPSSFEIHDSRVAIRKDVLRGQSVTTIASSGEQLVLTIDRLGVTVSSSLGRATARLSRPEEIGQVTSLLAGLPIVKDAAALLDQQQLDPATLKGRAFGLTKALLDSVEGDDDGTLAIATATSAAALRPGAILAGIGSDPGVCWDQYQNEAVRAANDYVDCYNNTHWYNFLDRMGCATVYDIEAEGDFIWYMNCVGVPVPMVRVA